MIRSEVPYLVMVIGAFTLFGCVLGWASWEESRIARKKKDAQEKARVNS